MANQWFQDFAIPISSPVRLNFCITGPIFTACDHVDLCTVASALPTMVDATPPEAGHVIVNFYNIHTPDNNDVIVRWEDFEDNESGIRGYELAVGTLPSSQDVVAFTTVSGLVTFFDGTKEMDDGKVCFFQIKVCIINVTLRTLF